MESAIDFKNTTESSAIRKYRTINDLSYRFNLGLLAPSGNPAAGLELYTNPDTPTTVTDSLIISSMDYLGPYYSHLGTNYRLYGEHNKPTAADVGAADADICNIRTYTSVEQIGLSDSDMGATADDLVTNLAMINEAIGNNAFIMFLRLTGASSHPNLCASVNTKIYADTGCGKNGPAQSNLIISRTGNIYHPMRVDAHVDLSAVAGYVFSSEFNLSGTTNSLTNFSISARPEGFISGLNGTMTGKLTITANSPNITFNEGDTNNQGTVYMNGGTLNMQSKNEIDNNSNWRALRIRGSHGSELPVAVFITDRVSDVETNYKIFGEHNITAGTTALTSGTSALTTGCIYQQYT